jgi:hypothetical protein
VLQMADDHDGQPLLVWCQVKEPKLEPALFVPREPLPKNFSLWKCSDVIRISNLSDASRPSEVVLHMVPM